jgi:transcriptional regulator with PAS, ATPase and Fis domain
VENKKTIHGRGHIAKYTFDDILGKSAKIKATIDKARRFGSVNATVLIYGETGVGKEYFAQAIHNVSPHRDGPFVTVNCAAMPDNLLESELFGYSEGAFTGAKKGGKEGLFVMANKGTIFLDEIGEMSDKMQTRLLRVLQEYEIMPLGDNNIITLDVRVVAATNSDLRTLVHEKRFRADLYHRINVLTLMIPALRDRREDIPVLFNHYLGVYNKKFGKNIKGMAPKGIALFNAHSWPGNIRELQNTMKRLVILTDGDYISADIVTESLLLSSLEPEFLSTAQHQPAAENNNTNPQEFEKALTINALKAARGNKKKAARLLGISRTTLWRRQKKYDIRI